MEWGWHLISKNNSDQSFLAQLTADKHDTHWTTAFVHWGTEELSSVAPLLSNHPSFFWPGPGLLDKGHPLLVLAVPLMVLLLFSGLAGLRAVIGHQWSRGLLYIQN